MQSQTVKPTNEKKGRHSPEVFIGVCEPQYKQQLLHPEQWSYILKNADGLYTNFHLLDCVYSLEEYRRFAELFAHKNAFIESDMCSSVEKEQEYIDKLQGVGFTVPYTSENYGWSSERRDNLKNYHLLNGQEPRLCFVQDGPWVVGGDIRSDDGPEAASNADYRAWAQESDGMSTDGPMGLWKANAGRMQEGSCSMIQYSHSLGKKGAVMICPYKAQIDSYSEDDFLEVAENCVRFHEDNDAEPDVWSLFEYCADIPAVPEQAQGAAVNTSTGMIYYLLRHLNGDPGTLDLYMTDADGAVSGKGVFCPDAAEPSQIKRLSASAPVGTTVHLSLHAANTSGWCDYAAVLKAGGAVSGWKISFARNGRDITESVWNGGYTFYKDDRLDPDTMKTVELTLTRTNGSGKMALDLELLPHATYAAADVWQIVAE